MIYVIKRFFLYFTSAFLLLSGTYIKSFARQPDGMSTGLQATMYYNYNTRKYRVNNFKALGIGLVEAKGSYTRSTLEGFYAEKKLIASLYDSYIQDYILSYGYGANIMDILQGFFTIFIDFGALLGYENVSNYMKVSSTMVPPFKSGLVFGIYSQINAELSLFQWLSIYARVQISYNGPIIYEQWPFYQGVGLRVRF